MKWLSGAWRLSSHWDTWVTVHTHTRTHTRTECVLNPISGMPMAGSVSLQVNNSIKTLPDCGIVYRNASHIFVELSVYGVYSSDVPYIYSKYDTHIYDMICVLMVSTSNVYRPHKLYCTWEMLIIRSDRTKRWFNAYIYLWHWSAKSVSHKDA